MIAGKLATDKAVQQAGDDESKPGSERFRPWTLASWRP